MTTESPSWFKSSYSGNGGADCVEVAHNLAHTLDIVPVRDSKVPAGPSLTVSATAFTVFVKSVKAR
ncbi:DUF397 domain-containing protein [Streptomyces sp. G2]|uniref:DUF397 domain-containing protein n=1 Tax=Streptomyces sp. G2 TaxID=1684471 RepID=UPI00202E58F3|nr:DUF397 domain-containing protein [Streptomyces sp. G2]MCM1947137.1 DUF397 domain-containing protein [Streptomyces sp. G2]